MLYSQSISFKPRVLAIAAGALWLLFDAAGAAAAQTAIVLRANPTPIVDAVINGHPVRLEVDLRLPDVIFLSDAAANRLGVHTIPFVHARVAVDDESAIRGRVARPRLVFAGGATARALTGVFAAPVSEAADGVIGPGVLPYDLVTVVLGEEPASSRDIVLTLSDPKRWRTQTHAGGLPVGLDFDLSRPSSLLNRSATRALDAAGLIAGDGEPAPRQFALGLSTMAQPIHTAITVEGFGLGQAFAQTHSPLFGALDEDTIVVTAPSSRNATPVVTLGREALSASACASISVNRSTRRLTLRCATVSH
jgi:hypothetical protein